MKSRRIRKNAWLSSWWLMLAVAALLLQCRATAQQTTGDVLGTVTDNTGAVVVHASVVALNLATNEKRTTPTNATGEFIVNLLKPGNYTITVTAAGFKSYSNPNIALAAGDRVRVDAHLTVGQTTETVTVESAAPACRRTVRYCPPRSFRRQSKTCP